MITLVLLGKYLEARAKARAARALEGLMRLQPKTAFVERDGRLVEVEVASLQPGDAFVVPKGVRHNPVAERECLVMLIERKSTQHTGDTITDKTRSVAEQLRPL